MTLERVYVTDTWNTSPAKREMVDTLHRTLKQLEQAHQRLQRVRAICEWNECDMASRQILLELDGHDTPLGAHVWMGDVVGDAVTLTVDQARDWIKSRTYKLRIDMAATERALLEERAMTTYLTQQRDQLAAEVAILKAELGCCRHVQPHER